MSSADTEVERLKADLEKARLKTKLLREQGQRKALEGLRPSLLENLWVGLAIGFFGAAGALVGLA